MSKLRLVALTALVALAIGPSLAAAPGDLTLRSTETGGGKPVDVTTYLTANAMKRSSSDGTDTIIKLDTGTLIFVDNAKKTYSQVTFQELESMLNAMTGGQDMPPEAMAAMRKMMGGGGSGDFTVTKVGPGDTIAGYATEKWTVTGPINMEIMAAPDLKVPTQYYDAMRARMPRNPMLDMGKMFEQMKKINGWPLKQVTSIKMMGRDMTSTSVVNAVDKSPIPASTFDVPAGYKKVDFMPQK